MTNHFRSRGRLGLIAIALFALIPTCTLSAQKSQTAALINEQLDKQVKVNWNGTLPDVIRSVGKDFGVRIEASRNVWELLPWGEQTNITAKIENQTLRQALEAITRKLGLQFVLKDEAIELQPMPALARLGHRSTVAELQSLDLLASTPLELADDHPTVRKLIDAVDKKLSELKSPFAIDSRPGEAVNLDQVLSVPHNATLAEALEIVANNTRATWYPWGKSIVVLPKEEMIRSLLDQTISVRYNGVDVAQVLTELAQRSGIAFTIEPGALQRIPTESRIVKLDIYNASIKQAMESIAGFTGLGYVVNENGVYIWNANNKTGVDAARDPTVALITLDSGMQVPIRASQVPPDLRQYIDFKMRKQFDRVREQMKEEGFKPAPTTAPTSQPAADGKTNQDL